MTTKDIVGKSVETVTFLLAAFSGFLEKVAPPEETKTGMVVGVVSIAALVGLLFVTAFARGKLQPKHKKYWLGAAGFFFVTFLIAAFFYDGDRTRLTFLWPPEEEVQKLYVGANGALTPKARATKNEQPDLTSTQLVSGFGGLEKKTAVWPAEAIQSASRRLKLEYITMVLSFALAVFCLTEGILTRDDPAPATEDPIPARIDPPPAKEGPTPAKDPVVAGGAPLDAKEDPVVGAPSES